MKGLWARWVAWTARDMDARPLALVRITTCLVLMVDYLRAGWLGLVPVLWRPNVAGGIPVQPGSLYLEGFGRLFGPEAGGAWAWLIGLCSMALAAMGVAARPALLLAALCHAQLGHLNDVGDRAIDRMLRTAWLVLVFSGAHRRFAIGGRPHLDRVPAWPADFLRFLLVLMYMQAGFAKIIANPGWLGLHGVPVLFRIMTDPMAAHLDPHVGPEWYPVFRFFSIGTILLELSAPFLLTRFAWIWALFGAMMHIGIASAIDIGVFSYGMLGLYPLLLVDWFETGRPWGRRPPWGPFGAARAASDV